ncbi:hypothetical protein PIB30_024134 [Stylosanthes scabra]|uniref:Late embryogenesis abundant protein LEA-2 subgroup domain-containing protein n=1 Tax=Stylosanthes scabra TaxID=79078 RepID=A0ABU6W9P9_9FABA|nr:hypothetical protein [Stylosanthes scabra]
MAEHHRPHHQHQIQTDDDDEPTQHHQPQHGRPHFQPKMNPHQRNMHMEKPNMANPRYYPPTNRPKREHYLCLIVTLLLLGIIILIIWLAYHPTKPHFTVASAAIFGLNATSPPLLAVTMQFSILIRNPNRRVSIYFDSLNAFVSYRDQPITPRVMLPPLYLEKHSTVALSPVIGGSPVPVSPEVSNGLIQDEGYGVVGLKLAFLGRLKWKAGDIRSAHYSIYVKCDMLVGLKKGFVGQVPLLGSPICNVDM